MVNLHLHWSTLVYGVILIILLTLTFWRYKPSGAMWGPDLSGLSNIFWGVVTVIFTLIWGGIFWW